MISGVPFFMVGMNDGDKQIWPKPDIFKLTACLRQLTQAMPFVEVDRHFAIVMPLRLAIRTGKARKDRPSITSEEHVSVYSSSSAGGDPSLAAMLASFFDVGDIRLAVCEGKAPYFSSG